MNRPQIYETLPLPVIRFLVDAAKEFRAKGANLILFGSFAAGSPRGQSDLDIAIQWINSPNPEVRRQISERLDQIPTIRPVDLIDLQGAQESLQKEIAEHSLPLADL